MQCLVHDRHVVNINFLLPLYFFLFLLYHSHLYTSLLSWLLAFMVFKGRATLSLIFNILHNTSLSTWYIVDVQPMLLSYEWCIQGLKEEEAKEERKLSSLHDSEYRRYYHVSSITPLKTGL